MTSFFPPDDEQDPQFSAALFRLVADSVGLIVAIYEVADDVMYLSDQWGELTRGVASSDYVGALEFRTQIHADDVAALDKAFRQTEQDDTGLAYTEIRIRSHPTGWRWVSVHLRLVQRDESGEPARFVCTMSDISARKQELLAAHSNDEFYRAIFEQNLSGILLGTPDGRILCANPAACAISGYSEDELMTMGPDDLLDSDDERLAGILKIRRYLGHSRGEVTLKRKDGQRVEVELSSVVYADQHGTRKNVIMLTSLAGDRAAARAVSQMARMYRVRQECSKAIILAKDKSVMLNEVSRVAVDHGGLSLAWVATVNPNTLAVQSASRHGPARGFLDDAYLSVDARVEEGQGPIGTALRENRVCISNDFTADATLAPWHELGRKHDIGSIAVLPLHQDETVAGALVLHAADKGFFTPQMLELLLELASEMSFGLDNLQRDAALQESELRFRTLWETTMDAILILDTHSTIHYANPAALQIYGYRIEDLIGRHYGMLAPPDEVETHAALIERLHAADAPRQPRPFISRGLHKNGRELPVEIVFSKTTLGGMQQIIGFVRDISDRAHAEQLAARHNSLLRMIADGAALKEILEAIILLLEQQIPGSRCALLVAATGEAGKGGAGSPSSFAQVAGASVPPALRAILIGRADDTAPALFARRLLQGEPVTVNDIANDPLCAAQRDLALLHKLRACDFIPFTGRDGNVSGALALYRPRPAVADAAEKSLIQSALDLAGLAIEARNAEGRIRYLAHHDELTGLANRTAFTQALRHAIARAKRADGRIGVLFIDLDRFKEINDRLGHEAGDEVLRQSGRRLREAVRDTDVVARLSGDQFMVMVEQYVDVNTLSAVAQKLALAIELPGSFKGRQTVTSASIAISTWPADGRDVGSLLQHADIAMYRIKQIKHSAVDS